MDSLVKIVVTGPPGPGVGYVAGVLEQLLRQAHVPARRVPRPDGLPPARVGLTEFAEALRSCGVELTIQEDFTK
jgi:hypothetical protein